MDNKSQAEDENTSYNDKDYITEAMLAVEDVFIEKSIDVDFYGFFILNDSRNDIVFNIGNVLNCLAFLEYQGVVPNLNDRWWNLVGGRYN